VSNETLADVNGHKANVYIDKENDKDNEKEITAHRPNADTCAICGPGTGLEKGREAQAAQTLSARAAPHDPADRLAALSDMCRERGT
jgi:hypothetical protein